MKLFEISPDAEPVLVTLLAKLLKNGEPVYYQKRPQSKFRVLAIERDVPSTKLGDPYWVLAWQGAMDTEQEWFNTADFEEMTIEKSNSSTMPGFILKKAQHD